MSTVTLHVGDVRTIQARLIELGITFDFLVTSPPFLALRSYLPADHPDKHREIGSEPTPAAFLDTMYGLTAEWGRLLPEWGSVCVELGDTMSGSGGAGGDYDADGLREGQPRFRQRNDGGQYGNWPTGGTKYNLDERPITGGSGWPLSKGMCILPHAYTLGLAYGRNPLTGTASPAGQWRVRNVIAWCRPNPPVGSLGKRNPAKRTGDYKFRPATSFITVACRGTGRYFDLDAVRVEYLHPNHPQLGKDAVGVKAEGRGNWSTFPRTRTENPAGAPPLDWHTDDLDGDWLWKLATAPYKGAHYATFPVALPRRLLAAMCPARVCQVCGWPSERISETQSFANGQPSDGSFVGRSGRGSYRVQMYENESKRATFAVNVTTLGWTDCGHDAWRPGRVLDPFGGSGTTAVAAALEQRDATLIDLDARNVDLVRRRLTDVARVDDERRDGDTITWTVTPLPRSQLAAELAGQLDLFAEGW